MRLVSKSFEASATPVLFRHIDTRGRDHEQSLLRLSQVSRSVLAVNVQVLTIGFFEPWSPDVDRLYQRTLDLARKITDIIHSLTRLKELVIICPRDYSREEARDTLRVAKPL